MIAKSERTIQEKNIIGITLNKILKSQIRQHIKGLLHHDKTEINLKIQA
jgi:hypothetical protein